VIAGTVAESTALLPRTGREAQKMPLLFYFPLIIWMGMMEIAHDEMRGPVNVRTRTPARR
jgi:hypothetical protein